MATVIIGAGAGGLAAAIALAARGESVVVVEKQDGPGGKLLPVSVAGRRLDSGPTVLTMMWVFEELFGLAGVDAWDALQPEPLSILARHIWSGGATLDLFADPRRTADAIGRFAGAGEARGFEAFAAAAKRIHLALREPFLRRQRPTPWGLSAAMPVADLLSINPFETLWHALGRYFTDKRLQQLFGRYATYCGSSPFKAPATLMLVADVEANGVWRLPGGMAALAEALHAAARGLGVQFHFARTVTSLEQANGRISAVYTDAGDRIACRAVVVNADSSAVASGLFGGDLVKAVPRVPERDRSLSAITWCGTMAHGGVALEHHNVFFSDDYQAEFAALSRGPASDPTVYICDQGDNAKLVLINAPANRKTAPPETESQVLHRLGRCGLRLDLTSGDVLRRSPREFAALYPASHGALYGRASHGWMSTFLRPQARTKIPNLYLAGGTAHPGPGVPMAALSGLRAADALLHDRASMPRSRPTVTVGGTSMP